MLAVLAVVFPVILDVFLSACTGRERLTGRVGGAGLTGTLRGTNGYGGRLTGRVGG